MKKVKNIFISFVGTNDAAKFKDQNDGTVLTALTILMIDNRVKVFAHNDLQKFEKV